ncbi:MAG TPA: GNAT family N-acyltransferase [Pyrinomonadaceae bacterium]|jgi:putative hemolysin
MPIHKTQAPEIHQSIAPEIRKAFDYPFCIRDAPAEEIHEGRYITRFAQTAEEIDAALRLRFTVFNLELNEGLESSFLTERDEDEFDQTCHHLIVIEKSTNTLVGTYRLRTIEQAHDARGFYSANEFKIEDLPAKIIEQSMEIGRACIAREHRNSRVLFLLWKGLALYASLKNKRYLFGCCSLFTLDCTEGKKALRQLVRDGFFHESFRVAPREECACQPADFLTADSIEEVELPKLFFTYLRIGAKICGEPVIDRHFKTIDFFVIFDATTIEPRYYQMFFSQFEHLKKN